MTFFKNFSAKCVRDRNVSLAIIRGVPTGGVWGGGVVLVIDKIMSKKQLKFTIYNCRISNALTITMNK